MRFSFFFFAFSLAALAVLSLSRSVVNVLLSLWQCADALLSQACGVWGPPWAVLIDGFWCRAAPVMSLCSAKCIPSGPGVPCEFCTSVNQPTPQITQTCVRLIRRTIPLWALNTMWYFGSVFSKENLSSVLCWIKAAFCFWPSEVAENVSLCLSFCTESSEEDTGHSWDHASARD